jgi:hypothetical protein
VQWQNHIFDMPLGLFFHALVYVDDRLIVFDGVELRDSGEEYNEEVFVAHLRRESARVFSYRFGD